MGGYPLRPSVVQRITAQFGFKTEYLAAGAEGYFFQEKPEGRFVFPDYDSFGDCSKGGACEIHAECVARVLGGHPIPISAFPADERPRASDPASSTPRKAAAERTIQERIRANHEARRKRNPVPSEQTFDNLDRQHLA